MNTQLTNEGGKVAVLGAGTIGASWAALFLAHGCEVVISDPRPGSQEVVEQFIERAWPALKTLGAPAAQLPPRSVRFEPDLKRALTDVDFVQENTPEKLDVKRALISQVDAFAPSQAIIASSSSGFRMSDLQGAAKRPERCLIGHPFNPPHLIPLVEVVGGQVTSEESISIAMQFYRRIGKFPIRLHKEVLGHIANRLQAALWREAIHLVDIGVASVADVDAAVSHGPGLRWAINGPHMTFHLGGGPAGLEAFLAHLLEPVQSWWADLGQPEMTPELQGRLVEGVAAEAHGQTTTELAARRDSALIEILRVTMGAQAESTMSAKTKPQ